MKSFSKKLFAMMVTMALIVATCISSPALLARADGGPDIHINPSNYTDPSYLGVYYTVSGDTLEAIAPANLFFGGDWTTTPVSCISANIDDVNVTVEAGATVDRITRLRGNAYNYGTIISAEATGSGFYNKSSGCIKTLLSYLYTNEGLVENALGGVDQNAAGGTIIYCENAIAENYGVVKLNEGVVTNNMAGGCVFVNNASVGDNKAGAFVFVNNLLVDNNDGTISKQENDDACVYSGNGYIYEAKAGYISSSFDGTVSDFPDPSPRAVAYFASLRGSDYRGRLYELSKNIRALASTEQGTTIYYSEGSALPLDVMRALKESEGVTLDMTCSYECVDYHFVIKGGKDMKFFDDIGWYGVLFLNQEYGNVE